MFSLSLLFFTNRTFMTSIECLMRNNAFNFPKCKKPSHTSIKINKFQTKANKNHQKKYTQNQKGKKDEEAGKNHTHHEQMTVIWKIVTQGYVYALQYLNRACHEIDCSLGFYCDVNFYYCHYHRHHHYHSIRLTNVNVLFLCIYRPPVAKRKEKEKRTHCRK